MCLVGRESEELHAQIQKLFWAMFEQDEHLDVLFLRDDEAQRIERDCGPFYRA